MQSNNQQYIESKKVKHGSTGIEKFENNRIIFRIRTKHGNEMYKSCIWQSDTLDTVSRQFDRAGGV
jgi:hypothetical protein